MKKAKWNEFLRKMENRYAEDLTKKNSSTTIFKNCTHKKCILRANRKQIVNRQHINTLFSIYNSSSTTFPAVQDFLCSTSERTEQSGCAQRQQMRCLFYLSPSSISSLWYNIHTIAHWAVYTRVHEDKMHNII